MTNLSDIWQTLGTTWSELSDNDKSYIETIWQMVLANSTDLYNKSLLQKNNWSILLATPFLFIPNYYVTLYSTPLTRTDTSDNQILEDYLIWANDVTLDYFSSGIPTTRDIVGSGLEFSSTEGGLYPDTTFNIGTIYNLTDSGFIPLDGITELLWGTDGYGI